MIDGFIILCITLYNIFPALVVLPISFFVLSVYIVCKKIFDLFKSTSENETIVETAEVCCNNYESDCDDTEIRLMNSASLFPEDQYFNKTSKNFCIS
jgi:hypothetical protein